MYITEWGWGHYTLYMYMYVYVRVFHSCTHVHCTCIIIHMYQDYEYEEDFDEVPEEEEDNESDEERTASSESEDEGISATPTKRRAITNRHPMDYNQGRNQVIKGQGVDLLAIMQAIDAENTAVESTNSPTDIIEPSFENVDGTVIVKFAPKDSSDGEEEEEKEGVVGATAEPGGTKFVGEEGFGFRGKLQSPNRKFVDFSHAQRSEEASLKVAKKTRKRAQVHVYYVLKIVYM